MMNQILLYLTIICYGVGVFFAANARNLTRSYEQRTQLWAFITLLWIIGTCVAVSIN